LKQRANAVKYLTGLTHSDVGPIETLSHFDCSGSDGDLAWAVAHDAIEDSDDFTVD
jgi:hypothetical protein